MGERNNRAQANGKPLFQAAFLQFSANCDAGAYTDVREHHDSGSDKAIREIAPSLYQCVYEILGVKGDQVVEFLAHADIEDRELEFHGDGDDHSALGGAVQLGEHDAVEVDRLGEYLRLRHTVLSRRRVEDEIFAEVRVRELAVHDAAYLFELFHEVLFVVQPSSGVHKDDVRALCLRGGDGVENDGGGVCALVVAHELTAAGVKNPVVFCQMYRHGQEEKGDFQIEAAADMGALMFDGLTDGLWLMNDGTLAAQDITATAFGILQAARLRTSKTEYISCPGCGRTLYDLRSTIARIKEATAGMKGLKIGIMGCIVNGPGEMADADYGYVGAGRGKISLYKGKQCVEKNIPEEEAVERLLKLIKG